MQKLSEITGEKSFDILAEIIEPTANIAADKVAAGLFGPRKLPEGMTVQEYVMQRVKEAIPPLMKRHKADLIQIFAVLSEMTVDEYKEKMTFDSIMLDLGTLISDPIFNAFFTMSRSTEMSSGSASENTTE